VLARVFERRCARLTSGHLAADVLDIDLRLTSGEHHQRRVALAHPLVDVGSMLTLLRLDLEAHPPAVAVIGVAVTAHPVRAVAGQGGLWHPTTPAVRELATVLTRLAALVGPASVGSPRLVDSHRADPVTVTPFEIGGVRDSPPKPLERCAGAAALPQPAIALRRTRPPRAIDLE